MKTKSRPKGKAGELALMIGLFFSSVFDPKAKTAIELIQSRRENKMDEAGKENE